MTRCYQNFHATVLSSVVAPHQSENARKANEKFVRFQSTSIVFRLITSLLFRNASICTWFRMLDFSSFANFALNAFFWLIIRKVSSWGAAWMWRKIILRRRRECENCHSCLTANMMKIYIFIALLSHLIIIISINDGELVMLTEANGISKLKQTIKLTSINNACKCQNCCALDAKPKFRRCSNCSLRQIRTGFVCECTEYAIGAVNIETVMPRRI